MTHEHHVTDLDARLCQAGAGGDLLSEKHIGVVCAREVALQSGQLGGREAGAVPLLLLTRGGRGALGQRHARLEGRAEVVQRVETTWRDDTLLVNVQEREVMGQRLTMSESGDTGWQQPIPLG